MLVKAIGRLGAAGGVLLLFSIHAAAAADRAAWTVREDPPATHSDGVLASASATPGNAAVNAKPDFALHQPFVGNWTIPDGPSSFALRSNMQHWTLWDLRTGKVAMEAQVPLPIDNLKLSVDGLFLAGTTRRGLAGRGGASWGAGVDVWALHGSRVLHYSPAGITDFGLLALTLDRRIIVSQKKEGISEIAAVPFSGSKPTVTIVLPRAPAGAAAVSPGGAYLALRVEDSSADLFEILNVDAGKIAGEISLHSRPPESVTAAFTPDGKHLIIAQQNMTGATLSRFSVATGALETALSYDPSGANHLGAAIRPIRFSPDGSTFLLGLDLFDSVTLRQGLRLEGNKAPIAAVWASPRSVLLFEDDFNTAIVESRSIGPEDSQVFAKPLDASGAVSLKIVSAQDPSPLPPPAKIAAEKPFAPAFELLPFAHPRDNGLDEGKMTIVPTSRDQHAVFVQRNSSQLERYDLVTGKGAIAAELPKPLQIVASSADGSTLLFSNEPACDELDVWTMKNGRLQPRAAFIPFSNAPPAAPAKPPARTADPHRIVAAAIIDPDHLLAVSEAGCIAAIEASTGKALWQTTLHLPGDGFPRRQMIAFSPARDVAAAIDNQHLTLINTLTGAGVDIELPHKGIPLSWTFSPDGASLGVTAFASDGNFGEFVNYPLASTGASDVTLIREPMIPAHIQFLTDDCVLINEWCYSLRAHALLCRYNFAGNFLWPENDYVVSIFDRPLRLVMDDPGASSPGRTKWRLSALALPDPSQVTAAAALAKSDAVAFAPGQAVRLNLTVVGDATYKQAQAEEWKKQLAARGVTISDSAGIELRVNNSVVSAGKTIYQSREERVGKKPEQVTVESYAPAWRIELLDHNKVIWSTVSPPPRPASVPTSIFIEARTGETLQQAADRENKIDQASHIALPSGYIPVGRDVPAFAVTPHGITPQGNVGP
jgi:hypothetical protein